VSKRRYFGKLIPPWQMPSDPVKAVWWFMRWLLQVLVHFFWIPILGMVIYESVNNWRADGASNWLLYAAWNGVSSGVITLLVGLIVWAILYVLLIFANISANVARVVNELNQFQRNFSNHMPYSSSYSNDIDPKVVEGTISEIEEEPRQ
jgi:ABC-type Fe3+ transport system permease subunit